MLSKRSIKNGIQLNGSLTTKEYIVELSKNWSEREINLFKKMTSQGGSFSIQGDKFTTQSHDVMLDSSGNLINISTINKPSDEEDIDLNYLK
jgi:hypothetical protein